MKAVQTLFVDKYTDGIIGPDVEMLGPVKDEGFIVANTAPGCWGPMITPEIRGGHEVTKPVLVEGAAVGDAIAIYIKNIEVTSKGSTSGTDSAIEGRFNGDPFVAALCPHCNTENPCSKIEGIEADCVKCIECGGSISPFEFTNGYTMVFDKSKTIGLTLDKKGSLQAAKNPYDFLNVPERSIQNPISSFAPADLPGVATRLRPFLGQLGTTPSLNFPDSHNAGDFGQFLVGAPHDYVIKSEELDSRTDGHMDINRVRAGAVLICPVKVDGGGVYLGDAHAMQGDGEIAGHTTDVAATVTLQVKLIKGLEIEGPILLPVEEDLPHLAKPFDKEERRRIKHEAKKHGMEIEETAPISFIGTGGNLNEAIDNGISRGAKLLNRSVEEIKNRLTITGGLEIGRAPGTITATFLAPKKALKDAGLWSLIQEHYNLKD
jgi:formamidase